MVGTNSLLMNVITDSLLNSRIKKLGYLIIK